MRSNILVCTVMAMVQQHARIIDAAFSSRSLMHHHHHYHHHHHHHPRHGHHHPLFGTNSINKYDNKSMGESSKGSENENLLPTTMSTTGYRRDFLSSMLVSSSFIMATNTNIAQAVDATETSSQQAEKRKKPNFSQKEIASFLHPIPTFAIVDQSGVPYMVVGEDAKLSAYFFTTYEEARRILDIASESADRAIVELKKEEDAKRIQSGLPPLRSLSQSEVEDLIGVNPWKSSGGARISSLPLDFSISLASRGKIAGSYFRIAPAEDDIRDSLEIETSVEELSEGKVPLFYIDDFEIAPKDKVASTSSGSSTSGSIIGENSQIPLYFQKSQLLKDYKKYSGGIGKNKKPEDSDQPPVVQVTELFSVLGQMAGSGEVDDDLVKLVLIPPKGSVEKAKLCEKKGRKASPYKIGERIVVL